MAKCTSIVPVRNSVGRNSSVLWLAVLLCFFGEFISVNVKAQSAELLLVNDHTNSVSSTMVALPTNRVYDALGIPEGSPVQVITDNGVKLPSYPSPDGNTLNILTGVSEMETLAASITPCKNWPFSTLPISTRHDTEKLTAMVSNGLLTAVYKDETFSIYLGNASKATDLKAENLVFENFSLHSSLHHDTSDIVSYRKEISPEGWTRVFRSDAPAVSVETRVENGKTQIIVSHEFIHEEAKPIQYREILTLMSGQPIIDYRSVFDNQGSLTCYLGSRVNQFSAFIRGYYNDDMQVVRADGQLVNEGRLGSFSPRWFSAVTKNGYSLCFTALKPGIPGNYYFDFHRANITGTGSSRIVKFGQAGIHNGAADAEKWAIFKPGEVEEIGVGVHVFLPGQEVRSIMDKNWNALASGKPMSIPSPLSVYLDGEPIQGGSVSSIPDAFSHLNSWLPKNASISTEANSTLLRASGKEGSLSRALYANMDNPFVIRGAVKSLTPGTTLSLNARAIDSQETYTLAVINESGILDIQLQDIVPWKGLQSFTLEFHLEGKRKCQALLSKTLIGVPPPEAPQLISPLDGVSLTDISAFYTWFEVKGCGEYEIDISTSADFTDPTRHKVVITNPRPYFYPRELLPPGNYHWRVRALQYDRYSTPGKWSEARQFELNNDHSTQKPILEISPKLPLISMRGDNWNARNAVWGALDEVIKPCFTFRTFPTEGDFYKNLEGYKDAGMKVLYEAMKPYSPVGTTCSLADIEYAYQHYPNVIGSCLGEEFYWYWDDEIAREYMHRHHILAAKYGRVFHWSDLHKIGWNELAKRPEYASGDMASVIIPLLKTTEPYTAYITQGHLAGWFLAGLTNTTGTQADIWYWASVGFRKCGENNFGVRQGYNRLMPPVTYLQHWLLGMMQGGTVFANEWGNIADREGPNELWIRYYTPFFKGIIEHQMIPTREEYLASTKVVVKGDLPDDFPEVERWGFSDPNYGPFEVLYRELYKASDPIKDFIPKNGRYGLVAVLPESVNGFQHEGVKVVSLNDLQTPEQVHTTFDPLYPESYTGDALVLQIGKSVVIMNSNENLDVDQNYEVPFPEDGLIKSIKGDICVHKYIMGKHENEGLRFWLQANVSIVSPEKSTFIGGKGVKEGSYETRDTEIVFECNEKPHLSWTPENAKVKSTWDAKKRILTVDMSHSYGAVSPTLEKNE